MLLIDKKTGEVTITPYSKFKHESVGLDVGTMLIQNHDFTWDDEIRDFKVIETDIEDRQAYIDSFADECGVYNVLKAYAKTGDTSLLSRPGAFYGDISELPVDELNPGKLAEAAEKSLGSLNKALGTSLSAEQLDSMTADELNDLIAKAVLARTSKGEVDEKKEGAE